MNCMLDTNIFNDILNKNIRLSSIRENIKCFVTHIQLDEIKQTQNEERKKKLLEIFNKVTDKKIPTDTFVLGVSRLGQAKLSNGKLYKSILDKLNKKNKNKKNNDKDVLIAETAKNNGFALITHDMDLFKVATKFGVVIVNLYYIIK